MPDTYNSKAPGNASPTARDVEGNGPNDVPTGRARPTLRRMLWSSLLATAPVGIWAAVMEVRSDFCWVYCWGAGRCTFIGVLLWLWIFAFLFFRLRGRIALVVCTAVLYLGSPHGDGSFVAANQASMVGRFREAPAVMDAYRKDHPLQGYPASIPPIHLSSQAEKFYRIVYTPIRTSPGGPVDDYTITATPNRWCCGFALSLAMRSDGLIHHNWEKRPATLKDQVLSPQ